MRKFIDITEKFHAGVVVNRQGKETGCEIFINPSRKEWKSLQQHDQVRAIITADGLLVWSPYGALHREVIAQLHLPNTIIPCVIYGAPGDACHVQITDTSRDTPWWHNGDVYMEVIGDPYLKSAFTEIEVSYYDEDIVGDWRSLGDEDEDEDEDEDDRLYEGTERVAVWSGATITVLHNPPKAAFERFVQKHRAIRGLVGRTGEDIWLWDASMAIHSNVMQELGLPESTDCVSFTDGVWRGPINAWDGSDQYVPAIQRISPKPVRPRSKEDDAKLLAILSDPLFD